MNLSISAVGVAKQVDQATAVAQPVYYHGVSDGAMAKAEVTDSLLDVTTGDPAASLAYREEVKLPTGFQTAAFTKAIGLYLLGILGNVETTGVAAPYTHVFTLADDVPWLSFFTKIDTWLQRNADTKLAELTLEWDGPKPLRIMVMGEGCAFSKPTEITIPTADERLGKFFTPVGGTFKGIISGTEVATWPVLKGRVNLKRKQTVDYYAHSITPGNIFTGDLEGKCEITVRASDMTGYNTVLTGAADGTTISGDPVIGGFESTFVRGTESLKLAATRVKYTATAPEAATGGGNPFDLVLSGDMLMGAGSTTPFTATLINDVAAY